MRRLATFGLAACLAPALGGCQYAASPFDGFGTFLGNTQLFRENPNRPQGNDETLERVQGGESAISAPPLLPEGGDVWPSPLKPIPSTQELQNLNAMPNIPGPEVSPTLPPNVFPTSPPPPSGGSLETPNGPAATYQGGSGIPTYSEPGRSGITNPNGAGTLTSPN
jgi:hypothetical protein